MISGINVAVVSGNAGRDAEVKFSQGGMAVGRFTLAVPNGLGGKDKEGNERPPLWLTVKVFGKQAEYCGENVKKGTGVCVTGRLEEEHWQSKEGTPMKAIVLIANEVRKNFENGQSSGAQPQQRASAPQQQQQPPQRTNGAPAPRTAPVAPAPAVESLDDSVPF
jgi:single-strand DNA-binding protein